MRPDQYERLQTLNEELTDVLIAEADPATWPGADTPAREMTKEQRGDRYWVKKNAFATVSLIARVQGLVGAMQADSNRGAGAALVNEGDRLLDEEVDAAEKEAKALMARLGGAGKAEFDKRVRGKA